MEWISAKDKLPEDATPAAPSDYHTGKGGEGERYRMCPLKKGSYDDVLVFRNIEIDDETIKALEENKSLGLRIADDGPSTIEPLTGTCKESACAWWDELKQCCAVLAIARAARQKGG